jgi:hypothetical protein
LIFQLLLLNKGRIYDLVETEKWIQLRRKIL